MRITCVSLLLCAGLLAAIPVGAEQPLSRTDKVLWTICTITLHDHASEKVLDECFARLREIDSRMSTNTPGFPARRGFRAGGKSSREGDR